MAGTVTIEVQVLPLVPVLQAHLDKHGMTFREAADELGVSHVTVSNWLRGIIRPTPTLDLHRRLVDFLGLSPVEVLELFGFDLADLTSDEMRGYLPLDATAAA